MTTHEAIRQKIEKLKREAYVLENRISYVVNEPNIKHCPDCKTNNCHYQVDKNRWVCAFC